MQGGWRVHIARHSHNPENPTGGDIRPLRLTIPQMPDQSATATTGCGPELTIVGAAEVVARHMSLAALVERIIELDHRVYSVESHGHIGSAKQWTPVFAAYPETWRVLITPAGEVVAYWQIAALTEQRFAQARAGLLHPGDLGCDDYSCLATPGVRNLYFVSVCIDPAWRDLRTRWRLIDSFFEAVEGLAAHGVFFDRIAATAHSDEGARTCEAFGLGFLHDAPEHGACYGGSFVDVVRKLGSALERRRPALAIAYGV